MLTLIYKRTHPGDPNPAGQFGVYDCMGQARSWDFQAVIGVGGIGSEARAHGINGKVNWIGIGARKARKNNGRGPIVTFDRFLLLEADGPDFCQLAPALAQRLYSCNTRVLLHGLSAQERREVSRVLALAERDQIPKPASARRRRCRPALRRSDATTCRC